MTYREGHGFVSVKIAAKVGEVIFSTDLVKRIISIQVTLDICCVEGYLLAVPLVFTVSFERGAEVIPIKKVVALGEVRVVALA